MKNKKYLSDMLFLPFAAGVPPLTVFLLTTFFTPLFPAIFEEGNDTAFFFDDAGLPLDVGVVADLFLGEDTVDCFFTARAAACFPSFLHLLGTEVEFSLSVVSELFGDLENYAI